MMKKTILCILLLLFACKGFSQSKESFEGVITYSIAIQFTDAPENYRSYFSQKLGNTLKVYHNSNGNIKREYIASGPNGYDFHLYDAKSNNDYSKDRDIDTIYFFDASTNAIRLFKKEIKEQTEEKVLGQTCKSVSFQGISEVGEQMATVTFYYSGRPIIDSELYSNWKDYFTDEFFRISKSPYLKYVMKAKYFDLIITAVQIDETELSDELFDLPHDTPVEEQKSWQ